MVNILLVKVKFASICKLMFGRYFWRVGLGNGKCRTFVIQKNFPPGKATKEGLLKDVCREGNGS